MCRGRGTPPSSILIGGEPFPEQNPLGSHRLLPLNSPGLHLLHSDIPSTNIYYVWLWLGEVLVEKLVAFEGNGTGKDDGSHRGPLQQNIIGRICSMRGRSMGF